MNLQLSTKQDLNLNLGTCFYTSNTELVRIEKTMIINPKLNFNYWNKKLLSALNSGVINQFIFDTIKSKENDTRQLYTLEDNAIIDKVDLITMINSFNLLGINTDGDSFSILTQLNELNYQVITKI